MNFSEKLGLKLGDLRRGKGLTQKELAQKLSHPSTRDKVTDSAVSKWETGVNDMPISVFCEICKILNADANELLELNK